MNFKIFILLLSISEVSRQLCYTTRAKRRDFEQILEIQELLLQDQTVETFRGENFNATPLMDKEVKNICPAIDKKVLNDGHQKDPLLGIGGFSVVFEASLIAGARAIKYISFKDYIEYMSGNLLQNEFMTEECLQTIIEMLDAYSPFKIYDNKQHKPNLELGNLSFKSLSLDPLIGEQCGTPYSEDIAKLMKQLATHYLDVFSTEVRKTFELSQYSTANENNGFRTFPKADYCIIAENMDIYLVMERLGPSLFDVRKYCPTHVGKLFSWEKLVTYIGLIYKANKLNELGYVNCDIKPENLIFSRNYSKMEMFFADYGLLTAAEDHCQNGTDGYLAPEVFLYKNQIDATVFNGESPFTTFLTLTNLQADAFGVGLLLLTLELPQGDYLEFLRKYQKGQDSMDTSSFSRSHDQLLNEIERTLEDHLEKIVKESEQPAAAKIKEAKRLFNKVLLRLLHFNPLNRYPLPIALHLLYRLFRVTHEEGDDLANIKELIGDDDLLKGRLGIPIAPPDVDSYTSNFKKASAWPLISNEYRSAMKDIEDRLLRIRPAKAII